MLNKQLRLKEKKHLEVLFIKSNWKFILKLIRNKYATKFLGERNPFGIIKSEKINSGHGNMRQQLHNSREFYQIVIRARKIDFFPQETRRRRNGENSTDK